MLFFGGKESDDRIPHKETVDLLVKLSSPRRNFLLLIFLSSIIATLGLLNDSPAVVIGAMVIAPLLAPVTGVGMGIVTFDWSMVKFAFVSIFLSVAIAVVTAMFITFQYVPLGAELAILEQTRIAFMLPVAIASGAAASLALSYHTVKESISGIAIAVALIPPLVTIGIGLGGTDWFLVQEAAKIFVINLFGIIGTSVIFFYVLGFASYKKVVEVAISKERKKLNT